MPDLSPEAILARHKLEDYKVGLRVVLIRDCTGWKKGESFIIHHINSGYNTSGYYRGCAVMPDGPSGAWSINLALPDDLDPPEEIKELQSVEL